MTENKADESKEQAERRTVLRVPCEVYSRVVGYLRPVQAWNQGKRQEFEERKVFRIEYEPQTGRQDEDDKSG